MSLFQSGTSVLSLSDRQERNKSSSLFHALVLRDCLLISAHTHWSLLYLQVKIFIYVCAVCMWCQSWIFSTITPVFSVTWSFINHSDMLICCSRNISYYNQSWKQFCCIIFLWNPLCIYFMFFWCLNYFESSKELHFWNRIQSCHLDQFSMSLLSKVFILNGI